MESPTIHIIYHPSANGYSAYSSELDGIASEAPTVQELFEKVAHLIQVRTESLREIGRAREADQLQNAEVIFIEE